MSGKHAYDMLVQDLAVQVEHATTDFGEKSESMAKRLQVKADTEGSFADTTSTKQADEKFIDEQACLRHAGAGPRRPGRAGHH